ncbi:hypothetical protein HO133_007977 [Letharia lupina]|uniref:GMC oxidoreductase n=1 Tax=Letharia lupina TaxID=560253 RepID=A0A8H6FH06_9LECA|nr:uncharacterized protein HO133_007977 [Letharia lupina]KAF6228247.1 hypothetical protein HO133_007977 [Letharia lupina]
MVLSASPVSLSLVLFLYTQAARTLEYDQSRTRLRSTAFGIPGQDAVYDYVGKKIYRPCFKIIKLTYRLKVVGGGTAGITIASRLAENSSLSVAIIEAGGFYEVDNGNYSVLPGLYFASPFYAATETFPEQPLVDWGLLSTSQAGALDRKIHYVQGKTLSGSSALNAMAYHRGTLGSYQRWADTVGDDSYTFHNLLPYFQKSCNFSPPDDGKRKTGNATVKFDPQAFSVDGGPLHVSYSNWVDPALTWFQQAFAAVGLPIIAEGFNSGSLTGKSSWIPSTIDSLTGERSSSQTSFLRQTIDMANLFVYTQAQATGLLFNSTIASGVNVTTRSLSYVVSARKEIILSAGASLSPLPPEISYQLFLGIGPRATLESCSIPVLVDLAGVGQNLQDQPIFGVSKPINLPIQQNLLQEPEALTQFLQEAAGPFSSLNGLIAFEKVPQLLRSNFSRAALNALKKFPADWPEVEYLASTATGPAASGLGLIEAALSAPLSRGNVTITSSDISVPPVINMGWYTDDTNADAQVAVAALKRIRQAFATVPNITAGPELAPGPTVQTDQEILTYIRNTSIPLYHAGATCAMGKTSDTRAVVDAHARVIGVQNLRVVDMSAVPFIPPGHPQATLYMLAEKIADDIRNGL